MANGIRAKKKRAIALAGGGPAAGLHIGALAALEDRGIAFDVFSLSCVGAWVGIVYNTRPAPDRALGSRAQQTYDFFEQHCFRDDDAYAWFPLNRGFAPDLLAWREALWNFLARPGLDFGKLVPPNHVIEQSLRHTFEQFTRSERQTRYDWNTWWFNDVLAVHPAMRYLTALTYRSRMQGLTRIFYENSPALREVFRHGRLYDADLPHIYHNAWRMPDVDENNQKKDRKDKGAIQIFHNRRKGYEAAGYLPISERSLCACSALPYIEESVEIGGHQYTEGALVDTVNFVNLLRDHRELDEIWVNRIVDEGQVRPARDLAGAVSNLPMQFCAEVGEDDIKLFREHLMNQTDMRPRVVEIPIKPDTEVNFDWSYSNLRQGFREGYEAVLSLLAFDRELENDKVAATA